MVFRRRRGSFRKLRLIPVDSVKNIAQFSSASVANGAVSTVDLIAGVDSATDGVTQVENGSMVHSIEVHLRVNGVENALIQGIQLALYKSPESLFTLSAADMAALGGQQNKRWVLHFDQLQVNTTNNVMEWHIRIKLPRSFKRFITSDKFRLVVANNSGGTNHISFCGFAIYKWYR